MKHSIACSVCSALCILTLPLALFAQPATVPATQPAFEMVGRIEAPEIRESSGVAASRRFPGVFWTHNDSGNAPALFAMTREGKLIQRFTVAVPNVDWEDMAIDGDGFLYLADIGNNARDRREVPVYRIAEPDPRAAGSDVEPLKPDRTWRLTFPNDEPFDAEALMTLAGQGYIISKLSIGGGHGLYRFRLTNEDSTQLLERIATLSIRSAITAGDISPDGRQLAILTVSGPSLFQIDGDPAKAAAPATWSTIFLDPIAEAICFTDTALLATSESRRIIRFPLPPPPATRPKD